MGAIVPDFTPERIYFLRDLKSLAEQLGLAGRGHRTPSRAQAIGIDASA